MPADTPALKVDFSGPSATPGTGQARFLRYHPFGVNIDGERSLQLLLAPGARRGLRWRQPAQPHDVAIRQAGVWEITVEARRTSDIPFTPFTLTAVGARRHRDARTPTSIASATIGVPVARSYTLTNQFGAFTGRATGTHARQREVDRADDRRTSLSRSAT